MNKYPSHCICLSVFINQPTYLPTFLSHAEGAPFRDSYSSAGYTVRILPLVGIQIEYFSYVNRTKKNKKQKQKKQKQKKNKNNWFGFFV